MLFLSFSAVLYVSLLFVVWWINFACLFCVFLILYSRLIQKKGQRKIQPDPKKGMGTPLLSLLLFFTLFSRFRPRFRTFHPPFVFMVSFAPHLFCFHFTTFLFSFLSPGQTNHSPLYHEPEQSNPLYRAQN